MRSPGSATRQAAAHRLGHRGGTIGDAELVVEVLQVRADRRRAEHELPGHLGRQQAGGRQHEDLVLARAEDRPLGGAAHPDLAGDARLHLRGENRLAARDRGDRVAQDVGACALEQAARGAGADGLEGVRGIDVRRQQQDARRQGVARDRVEEREPVHSRHLEIDDRDVGPLLADRLETLAAVGGLADELELGAGLDRVDHRLAKERMVLDDQDADACPAHARASWLWSGRRGRHRTFRSRGAHRRRRSPHKVLV